jgi:hypothetical protein
VNNEILQIALIHFIKTSHNISACDFCKHAKPCLGRNCSLFIEGVGDVEGKYPTMKWTCEDFNFGTCLLLENTPCNGCIQNDSNNFELDEQKLKKYLIEKHLYMGDLLHEQE